MILSASLFETSLKASEEHEGWGQLDKPVSLHIFQQFEENRHENLVLCNICGLVLGNDKFRRQIKQLTGQSVQPGKPGRPFRKSGLPNQTTTCIYSDPQL